VTIPPYARLAARLLQREHDEQSRPAAPPDAVRADAVAAIERAIAQRSRRRLQRRAVWVGAGLAASLALAVVARGAFGPAPTPSTALATAPAPAIASAQVQEIIVHGFGSGAQVTGGSSEHTLREPGGRVQVPASGHALLAFATGTRVTLEAGADLTLVENDAAQVLALDKGALRADVAKLAPGHRFLVHTADAEVEVHGTSFRVLTDPDGAGCGDGATTRVEVFEGVVTVRHAGVEHRITPGGHWPESCSSTTEPVALGEVQLADQPEPPAVAPAREPAAEHGARGAHAVAHAARPRARLAAALAPSAVTDRPVPSGSSLVEQNDAFAAAVAAHRAGDLARAARGFEALIAHFPEGPLAESAAVQHMKVMLELDHERAKALAHQYLDLYPDGFARDHAASIADESP